MTELAIRSAASLPEKIGYAKALAASGMLPAQYQNQPANLLWAIEYGETLGITAMAAITGVHVIERKPSASAALIGGLVRRAGHKLRVTGDNKAATAQIIRSDDPDYTFEVTFTIDDAKTAGLLGKPVWKNYPAAMLKSRAITQVARDACEEVLFGLHYTPEELGAETDAEGNPLRIEQPTEQRAQRSRPTEPPVDEWSTPEPQPAADAKPEPAIEDIEVVDETPVPATAEMAEKKQLTKIRVLCNGLGIRKDADVYAKVGALECVGRTIGSTSELTKVEASRVIDALNAELNEHVKPVPSGAEETAAAIAKLIDESTGIGQLQEVGKELGTERDAGRITPKQADDLTKRWLDRRSVLASDGLAVVEQDTANAHMVGASS